MRIATFNAQNLRLRHWPSGPHLDGARDEIVSHELEPAEKALDAQDRELTARLVARSQADVIALQEVFDQASLDYFHDALLAPRGAVYPHRVCLEGNDGRRHVALMSRLPLTGVQGNARVNFADIGAEPPDGTPSAARVFRRDCLVADCGPLTLFVCHFKARADDEARDRLVRRAEALAVRRTIERRFANPSTALWLALGDFNAHDAAGEADLAPLLQDFAVDLSRRAPEAARWTYYRPDTDEYSWPDRVLASPALAERNRDASPAVDRMGLARYAGHSEPRFPEAGEFRPHASDHALVAIDVEV
jgi:endonuclease/exonuclease/phosphatase family metal-dependent hydrolase